MGEAKGPCERTKALHLGTWLYIDIYGHVSETLLSKPVPLYKGQEVCLLGQEVGG